MYKLTRILFKHFRFMLRSTYRYTQTLAANATLSIYFSITHKRNRRKISPRPLLLAFLGLFFFSLAIILFLPFAPWKRNFVSQRIGLSIRTRETKKQK